MQVYDQSVRVPARPGASCDQQYTVSLLHGAIYLGVLLLVTLLVSVAFPSGAATSPDRDRRTHTREAGPVGALAAPGVQ